MIAAAGMAGSGRRMSALVDMILRWWWWLWTGHPSRERVRRELEEQVRRYGGTVKWEDAQ